MTRDGEVSMVVGLIFLLAICFVVLLQATLMVIAPQRWAVSRWGGRGILDGRWFGARRVRLITRLVGCVIGGLTALFASIAVARIFQR